jgi:stage II sporulation protein D
MSQYGARGRADAGQTYQQIMAHYYKDTTLGLVTPGTVMRVLLASSYAPTLALPARLVARNGAWQSPLFPGQLFPSNSYIQMVFGEAVPGDPTSATWLANVHSSAGLTLASAAATDVAVQGADATTLFEMKWRDSLRKYDLYRGDMRLLVTAANGIQAINVVEIDDYLMGVVPAEIVPLWHVESLRAQAVAARGYAVTSQRPGKLYDVVPTSADQVYGGINIEHPRTSAAVMATDDVVVLYQGKPVKTFFHTTSGGHTENNEYAFMPSSGKPTSTPLGYLRGRPDLAPNGIAYDSKAPQYAWSSGQFTMAQLQSMLAKDARTNAGSNMAVAFNRGVSGRVYQVVIDGSKGMLKVSGGIFKGVYNKYRLSGASLSSTMFYLTPAN